MEKKDQIEKRKSLRKKKQIQLKLGELQRQNKKLQAEQEKYANQFLIAVKHLSSEQQERAKLTKRLEQQEEYTKKNSADFNHNRKRIYRTNRTIGI